MVVDDEPFLSVVGARPVWADDPEYLAFSEEHATRARTRFTRAAPDPQHIVSTAAERAVRTVTGRLGGGSHPRILRADVIYRGRRAPEPFYLELDAVTQSPTGLSGTKVKAGWQNFKQQPLGNYNILKTPRPSQALESRSVSPGTHCDSQCPSS